MQAADRRAIEDRGIPAATLMERAGRAVADAMARHFPQLTSARCTILCGRGNNGGDGFVIARLLRERVMPPAGVYLLGRTSDVSGAALSALNALLAAGGQVTEIPDESGWNERSAVILASDIIVDAMVGTGSTQPLSGLPAIVAHAVNERGVTVVAVDLPSGLLADRADIAGPAVKAALTVTFAVPKIPLVCAPAAGLVGRLVVADIGIPGDVIDSIGPPHMTLIDAEALRPRVHPRALDAHKGSTGHVLVVAGSRGKTGAAALSAMAALRSGAGLVTVATPASCATLVSSFAPEIMTIPLPETPDGTASRAGIDAVLAFKASVLAVGPGLGAWAETVEFIREIVKRSTIPIVLDADGLNAFAGRADTLPAGGSIIATPHPGEMARLISRSTSEVQAERLHIAAAFSAERKVILVLKGQGTIVASPDRRLSINSTGNPGMATAGMGDVLTGVIAAVVAQGFPLDVAARLGVFLHGAAGDLAAEQLGPRGLMAHDLIDRMPAVWRRLDSPSPSVPGL